MRDQTLALTLLLVILLIMCLILPLRSSCPTTTKATRSSKHSTVIHETVGRLIHAAHCRSVRTDTPSSQHRGIRSGFPLPTPAAPVVPGDYAARLPATSPRQECLRNGMIAKDKFCLSRSARLRLSWSRQPVRSNLSQERHIGHPSEQDDWNQQEGANAAATTRMEHLPSVHDLSRGMEALGSGLPSLTHPDQPSPEAGG
jgi:hypothetical protein